MTSFPRTQEWKAEDCPVKAQELFAAPHTARDWMPQMATVPVRVIRIVALNY